MSSAEKATEKKDASPAATETKEAPATSEKMADDVPAATKPSTAADAAPASEPTETSTKSVETPAAEAVDSKTGDKAVEQKDAKKSGATEKTNEEDTTAADGTAGSKSEADVSTAAPATESPVTQDKSKDKSRRKSGTVPEHKGKKLNKKGSKARITNLGAQPGDLYLMKLKGYPPWPVIVCDEDMLPQSLLLNRPVAARRADGTYREDFADGGKRAHDRAFPVMYLYTNEFGWVNNMTLMELTPERAKESINDKMRKDLQQAYELASQGNDLDYYKQMLREFQEEALAREEAKLAKQAAKTADAAAKDEDVEMEDAGDSETPAKKSKKRKAEGEATTTPARSDSVKKPKIKITSSATKSANGASTPKPAKEPSSAKATSKPAAKKAVEEKKSEPAAPKEPELTPEERHKRKEKEVLFLRHKLQKGLLTRDQEPKEEEMKMMSDYLTKLEGFPELEVSIIRVTKINKVLKAILKLDSIPRESEFNFKDRSQVLLDKWNKLLADAPAGSSSAAPATEANGVNGVSAKKDKTPKAGPNGVADGAESTAKSEKESSAKPAEKEAEAEAGKASDEAKPVEATA